MFRAILAALALAACATQPRDQVQRVPSESEDAEGAVRRMQDEFNNLIPNG